MRVRLREAEQKDIAQLAELFKETVSVVNAADYSLEETEDWASCGEATAHWEELINRLYFVVAEKMEGRKEQTLYSRQGDKKVIVGFAAMSKEGYLNSMFVHKDYQRCGVARILLQEVERYAWSEGVGLVSSEVSITARHFFETEGYVVVKEQTRRANKLELRNFLMEKKSDK